VLIEEDLMDEVLIIGSVIGIIIYIFIVLLITHIIINIIIIIRETSDRWSTYKVITEGR
jgi:hypothetical protein